MVRGQEEEVSVTFSTATAFTSKELTHFGSTQEHTRVVGIIGEYSTREHTGAHGSTQSCRTQAKDQLEQDFRDGKH